MVGVGPGCAGEKARWEMSEGEVQSALRGTIEDLLGTLRGFGNAGSAYGPDHNVELRSRTGDKARVRSNAGVEAERGFPALLKSMRKLAAADEGQKALGGPKRHGRCARPRAFEADLAKVEFAGSEVGVGRVVLVPAAHGGIAEQDAAAAVGLQTMLVRVDDDGVGLADPFEGMAAL